MKKLAILLIGFIALTACNSQQKTNSEEQVEVTEAVGGDKDDHGCLTAAGETWSALLEECVQLHEVGERLNPVEVEEGATVISAFVIIKEDGSQAELFTIDNDESVLLELAEDGVFQNEVYKYNAEEKALYVEDAVVYKGE